MLIAHLADLHLGYRAYQRLDERGMNQRERDVAEAFDRAVAQMVTAAPELVVVAGDIFHTARPPGAAITEAFRQFSRLRRGLPETPIVVVGGRHDAPRSAAGGTMLRLLGEIPNLHVADERPRVLRLARHDLTVACLPHAALAAGYPVPAEPEPRSAVNVLVAHGMLRDPALGDPLTRRVGHGLALLRRDALRDTAWDYVALGHHHDAATLARNVWYAGAIERTSPDVWAEAETAKGWVLFDTAAGRGEFREVQTRTVLELPPFSARAADSAAWLPPAGIDARIQEAAAAIAGGVAGKIVRQVITDVPRELFRQLDHRQIRRLKAEALHYQLEPRRPAGRPAGAGRRRGRTLEAELAAFMAGWETTFPGTDRSRLLELGLAYLGQAEDGG
jgi:DNA repair protein SbcD/Mre11